MQLAPYQPALLLAAAIMSMALAPTAAASGFLLDGQGRPVRDSKGHCIQVGALTPADTGFDCPGTKAPQPEATPDASQAGVAAGSQLLTAPGRAAADAAPVAEAPAEPAPALVERTVDFVSRQQFPRNSSYLSAAQKHELLGFVRQLEQYSRLTALAIAAHTDNTGALRYNRWLAGRRADAVAEYLRSLGMDPRIISIKVDAGSGSMPRGVEITVTVLERR